MKLVCMGGNTLPAGAVKSSTRWIRGQITFENSKKRIKYVKHGVSFVYDAVLRANGISLQPPVYIHNRRT